MSYCKTEGCLEDAIGNGISDLCPDHEQEACESRFPSDKPDKQEQYYFSDNDYDSCHEIICRELEAHEQAEYPEVDEKGVIAYTSDPAHAELICRALNAKSDKQELRYTATIPCKTRAEAVEACENVWGGDLRWDSDGKAFPDTDENPCVITRKALEQSEWERVLIERLVVLHILSPEHETNPSKALHDIISYEVLISLDPLVSSDAVALIEKYGGIYPPAEVET